DAVAERTGLEQDVPFLCECADPECVEIVRLGLAEYEAIRRNPRRFFNAPGHQAVSVDAGDGMAGQENAADVGVERTGVAGEVAEREAGGMEEPSRRVGRNVAVFREVNEQIESLNRGLAGLSDNKMHIVCECADLLCAVQLTVTVDEYERVRS